MPRPHFLGRALIWPGYFGEHILALFGLHPSSLSKSAGFIFYLGKLHWFLFLLLSYYCDPAFSVGVRISWKKLQFSEGMAAKMASRVSYLVYYYCI